MDTRKKMLPIGVEDFEKIRISDYYYVDKTGMKKELVRSAAGLCLPRKTSYRRW